MALSTLMIFTAPARLAAQRLATWVESVWVYHFEFDAGMLGAAHAAELPLLFGTFDKHWILQRLSGSQSEPEAASALAEKLVSSFASFAQTGSPSTGLPEWAERYTPTQPSVFAFRRESGLTTEERNKSTALEQSIALAAVARRPWGLQALSTGRDSPPQRSRL